MIAPGSLQDQLRDSLAPRLPARLGLKEECRYRPPNLEANPLPYSDLP